MPQLTDSDKQRLGLFLVAYTSVFLAFYLTQDTDLAKYGPGGRPVTEAAPAPTPLDLIRGLNDTCMTFVNVTDKRQHIYCNLRWRDQESLAPYDYYTYPGRRAFWYRIDGWPTTYDVHMPLFMHGDGNFKPMLWCGMFELSRGRMEWPQTQECRDPHYLYNNRPCNGLQPNATAEQVEHLLTYGWYRDVVQSEWEHYGNVTGVRNWQVYVTCSL